MKPCVPCRDGGHVEQCAGPGCGCGCRAFADDFTAPGPADRYLADMEPAA